MLFLAINPFLNIHEISREKQKLLLQINASAWNLLFHNLCINLFNKLNKLNFYS